MKLKNSEEGFVFTLDATLAILVSLLALASVASIGSSLKTHEQFGRLRLQRVGQDAVRALSEKGVFENAVLALENGRISKAERLLRENLNKAMPEHTQFKLFIRDQLLIYPTKNEDEWENLYENIEDRTVANLQYSVPAQENYFRVLTWENETREETLVDNINTMRPLWFMEKVSDQATFQYEIERTDNDGNSFEYYDTVFIPDADIEFSEDTIDALKNFAKHGRLVVAGDTLYNNQDTVHDDDEDLTPTFGIYDWDDDGYYNHDIRRHDYSDFTLEGVEKMYCQPIKAPKLHHPILYGFTPIDNLSYDGDYVYTYDDYRDPIYNGVGYLNYSDLIESHEFHDSATADDVDYDHNNAHVLTNWGHGPEDQRLATCGVIVNNEHPTTGDDVKAIFIPANVAQTVNRDESAYKWLRLTANSLSGTGGYELFHDPITISLWRGEGL